MQLLSRERECAVLDRVRADAILGSSQALVLRGGPGAGKSALLDYMRARLAGWQVLSAVGIESESELAYSGLHQVCAPLLEEHLDQLPSPQRDALTTALGLASGSPPDRFLVGLATLTLLAAAAEDRPVAWLVDDAHWLDEASAPILSFVARRICAEPVALVFATRAEGKDDVLAGLAELSLHALSDRDARTLLLRSIHGPLDSAVVEQIVTECHGNPLALTELPRTWQQHELAGGFGFPVSGPVTHQIEQSYVRRLISLPPQTQMLTLAAAAEPLGDPAILSRAADLLGTNLEMAYPAVDDGLLELSHQVRFAHPLVRAAIYHHYSTSDRQRVHSVLAAATDAQADPDRRAWHLAHATGGPDESVAVDLERSADRARARGGVAAAAAFMTRAMELTPEPAGRRRRALLAALLHLDAGAIELARRLLAVTSRSTVEEGLRAQWELANAQLALASSRGNDAAAPLLAAAQRLVPIDNELARETYLDAFTAALFGARLNSTVDAADVAAAVKTAPRGPGTEPKAIDFVLEALIALTEDYESAVPLCRQAITQLHADKTSLESELRWYWHGTVLALEVWDAQGAYSLSVHHARVARSTGALSQLTLALSAHIPVLVFCGELSAAVSAISEGESVEELTGVQAAPYGALMVKAWSGLERETKDLVTSTIREASRRGEGIGVAVSEYARAVLCNSLGQYKEAFEAATRATQDTRELVSYNWGLSELVEAGARSGQHEASARAQHTLRQKARASATDWALGLDARALALITTDETAEIHYRESIAYLERTRVLSELARTHLVYGEWLRRAQRRADARRELSIAYDSFGEMEMAGFAERARRELLTTGATIQKRTIDHARALTPQEAHIARLARDGLSNSDIGSRLFLSARTVEWHLGKVFGKLDISSRRELREALSFNSLTPGGDQD